MLWLGGCASVDFDYPKTETVSLSPEETSDTYLAKAVFDTVGIGPKGESAFHLMPDGVEALAVRLGGAARSERTLDVMYYLYNSDLTGLLLIDAMLQAADRGVRVRLLLDDVLTRGYDKGLMALDTHPNFEIRMFNPWARRSMRALNMLTDFGRLNRRMHNKAFIMDNQAAVIGGRNIGNEYFAADEAVNFGDLDVLALGPIVDEISDMFDLYWNHKLAVPVPAVVPPPSDANREIGLLRQRIADALVLAQETHYGAMMKDLLAYAQLKEEDYLWAPYQFIFDSPDKAIKKKYDEADTILPPMREILLAAEKEIIVVSPYFVPLDTTIEGFGKMRERGVETIVITNSLASNNHTVVHSGYAPSRKPLLKQGVRLYEIRPDLQARGVEKSGIARSGGTLHTKAFIVDREKVFIGTFNWDPRSAYLNTEMGVVFHEPVVAEEIVRRAEELLPTQAYRLELNEDGKIRWHTEIDGQEVEFDKEPETSAWKRFKVKLFGLLPIKKQL
jgi:putative cardiolipin synthase